MSDFKQNKKKLPREGFRKRVNPYYDGMDKHEIAADVTKTVFRWLAVTVLSYGYWLMLLLLFALILLSVWKVTFVQLLGYAGILCAITAVVYAVILVRRRFYY